MYSIAMVDDDPSAIQLLSGYIRRYCSGHSLSVKLTAFSDGKQFLEAKTQQFDAVFLDISMNKVDGLQVAAELRRWGEETEIIFVTQLAQYAVHGYRVNALDFLVKPVEYYAFELVFRKLHRRLAGRQSRVLCLQLKDSVQMIPQRDIDYVDILDHYLTYHTVSGTYTLKGTLDEAERSLDPVLFYRCHRCYLVNISRIRAITRDGILVGDTRIEVSRARREGLILAVTQYMGGGQQHD